MTNKTKSYINLKFRCSVNNSNEFIITCIVNNVTVGVYRYSQISETQSHHWIMVEPEFQGLGLGSVMILHAIDQANYLGLGYSDDCRGYSKGLERVYQNLIRLGLVDEYQGCFSLTALGRKTIHK